MLQQVQMVRYNYKTYMWYLADALLQEVYNNSTYRLHVHYYSKYMWYQPNALLQLPNGCTVTE